ncbi:hypothetical protein RND71_004861 [Anisodus tanguticus]|uniref:Uncharacterized protein n=1 Tax=Anisodus tanguticus TaxID=243964 RepID=A0AAE1VUK7_9SOLA|nr:hypothetical protein RND71_004861 [Anisodus tanguticus]
MVVDKIIASTPAHSSNNIETKSDQKGCTSVRSWADMVEEEEKVSSPPMCSKLSPVAPAFVPSHAMILPSLGVGQLMAQSSAPLNVSVSNTQLIPTNVLHALMSHDMKKLKDMNNPTKNKSIGIVVKSSVLSGFPNKICTLDMDLTTIPSTELQLSCHENARNL